MGAARCEAFGNALLATILRIANRRCCWVSAFHRCRKRCRRCCCVDVEATEEVVAPDACDFAAVIAADEFLLLWCEGSADVVARTVLLFVVVVRLGDDVETFVAFFSEHVLLFLEELPR
jgi:hypothetical protein